MKRFIIVAIFIAMVSTAVAQETTKEIRYIPEKGDIRVGLAFGWAMRMNFEDRPGFGHTKPIMPLQVHADYTLMTFAEEKGSVAVGAMFEFLHYQTWFTQESLMLGTPVKTTQTWTQGVLAATGTLRYCIWKDVALFGSAYFGPDIILGYKEEYSDESYASVVPHTNAGGSHTVFGFLAGVDVPTSEHAIISLQTGFTYMTLGFRYSYVF